MSEIAAGLRARRRRPPKKLLVAFAWLVLDLAILAIATFRISSGHATPAAVIVLLVTLFVLPPEWWVFKREFERWRRER